MCLSLLAAEDILLNGLTPGWFVPSEPDPANVTGEEGEGLLQTRKEKRGQDDADGSSNVVVQSTFCSRLLG